MNKSLAELLERVKSWPEYAREELEQVAREIDAELASGNYHATPEELAGIDRGLRASANGELATREDVEATFARHSGA